MKTAIIVGSGQRVRESALPAFLAAKDQFRLGGIYSRTPKQIETDAGEAFEVESLEALDSAALASADVLYMVVAKNAVPSVLRRLAAHDRSRLDLLIETPVLRFKHLGHRGLLDGFRNTWVTEDTVTLPAFDAVEAFRSEQGLGPVERATLDRSGYAYHGMAIGRHLLGGDRVQSGRRKANLRTVRFASGGELRVIEPRDYKVGRIHLECGGGLISDDPNRAGAHRWAPVVEGERCVGFRVGDTLARMTAAEVELMGTPLDGAGPEAGVTAWMAGMKRVGFVRLLERVADGRGAYPLEAAIEDTVVDYHLEKLRRYLPNPLTSPHFGTARMLMKLVSRVAGG